MKQWAYALSFLSLIVVSFLVPATSSAQASPHASQHSSTTDTATGQGDDPTHEGQWEGSAQGTAYSEFNHRFIGLLVFLFGLAELGHAVRYPMPLWTRLVLPGALGIVSFFLLVWSDHEAWPIGALSFADTFFGHNREIIQHKLYGVCAGVAAVSETLRRVGRVNHSAWAAPLVCFGLFGGLLLFAHSHGDHAANGRIELHHALLGSLGMGAAVSRAVAVWLADSSAGSAKRWEVLWAGFVIVMGVQLLVYFE